MGASTWKKFLLLLWKNFLLQKRHAVQSVVELVLPLIFVSILLCFREVFNWKEFEHGKKFGAFAPTDWEATTIHENLLHQRLVSGTPYFNEELYEVFYAPKTNESIEIMNIVEEKFLQFHIPELRQPSSVHHYEYKVRGFANESALLGAYQASPNKVLGAVVFHGFHPFEYSLRFPPVQRKVGNSSTKAKDRWNTHLLYPVFQLLGPRVLEDDRGGLPGYSSQSFTFLQFALDASIIRYMNPSVSIEGHKKLSRIGDYEIEMERFPYPKFTDDPYLLILQKWLPLIIMISFIYPVMNTTKSIVVEKEKGLKDSMKIMGLPNYLHWLAWFVKTSLFLLISVCLLIILFKVKFTKDAAVIDMTGVGILLYFLMSYVLSGISFAFLISVLFSNANNAAAASGVLWFLSYIPYFFLQPRYESLGIKLKVLSSLLSNTGMAFGCQILVMAEGLDGVSWRNLAAGPSMEDKLSLLHILFLLQFDTVLYLVVALYIEGIRPGQYGVPLPWHFPLTKSYWRGKGTPGGQRMSGGFGNNGRMKEEVEELPPQFTPIGVRASNLTKIFKPDKVAVKNLTLDMYQDQITILLGHNGSGKTTFMSMLAGVFPPSEGYVTFQELLGRTDLSGLLGLCPQHDVLFDELTVEEHLTFFCLLKNHNDYKGEVQRMITLLGLESKRNSQARTLSGGMKRKLCVGIALVGGSKIVLLDEPTSGMDPSARRATWDLLTSEKKNRTMVLSTHFMEEADLLGDRIAIMAEGELQTVGSSFFLKKKFGGGYRLIVVKKSGCNVLKITQVLQRHLGMAVEVEQDVGAELTYSLPDSQSALFGDLFEELEQNRASLGIEGYGAGITSLEEVFERVLNRKRRADNDLSNSPLLPQNPYREWRPIVTERNMGKILLFQQLRGLMTKKLIFAWRNKGITALQILAPFLFLLLALVLLITLPISMENPRLAIGMEKFGWTITTLHCDNSEFPTHEDFCHEYIEYINEVWPKKSHLLLTTTPFEDFIVKESEKDLVQTNQQYIVGADKDGQRLKAYFNNQPYHGQPISLNFLTNALLRHYTNSSPDAYILAQNHPLPYSTADGAQKASIFWSTGFMVGFHIAFGMCFVAAGFLVFLIHERESQAKHLQLLSGLNVGVYWLGNFLVDALHYLLPCVLVLVAIVAFRPETFDEGKVVCVIFLLLLLYGWAILPLMYLLSFTFSNPSEGFSKASLLNGFTGIGPIIAVSIVRMPELNMMKAAKYLEWIFLLSPNYCLCFGISSISTDHVLRDSCLELTYLQPNYCTLDEHQYSPCCTDFNFKERKWYSYCDFHPAGIGRHLLSLFIIGLVGFLFLFLREFNVREKLRRYFSKFPASPPRNDWSLSPEVKDSDVEREERRLRNVDTYELFITDNLVVQDLSKTYRDGLRAVKSLNFGVQHRECFGLLGTNGAGKTTTFRMLTGDLCPTGGNAWIFGHGIKTDIRRVQQHLGYCPQVHALIEELTGAEILRLFARLRGVPEVEIPAVIHNLASMFLFSEHVNKRVGSYSGGTKRKLSTALALVGNPPIVFLDEPTTGMDPVARRQLWNCISKVRDSGTSIVLTSHSMDECEALCTRLAIMVNGEFKCLGSIQHLKSKFGEGYTIMAQMKVKAEDAPRRLQESLRIRGSAVKKASWEEELEPLRRFIEDSFPGSRLKDIHPGYVHYHVQHPSITWGTLFRKMEIAKQLFPLDAYSVGQITLEQVFLNFTKTQTSPEEDLGIILDVPELDCTRL